jgi:protein-S-isoprenylcysteine O-methyltransferase Ste14
MQRILGALILALLPGIVWVRVMLMRRRGLTAMHFGKIDKTDYLILPFVAFYFYLVFAAAFKFPSASAQEFFRSELLSWIGAILCLSGLFLLILSLISFGQSFRVGIDSNQPDQLITTGVFAFSRNPIYVAFGLVLLGEFLVFPNWILLIYLFAAIWLFHRQVLREEKFLREHYGEQYLDYCARVRRYL